MEIIRLKNKIKIEIDEAINLWIQIFNIIETNYFIKNFINYYFIKLHISEIQNLLDIWIYFLEILICRIDLHIKVENKIIEHYVI